MTNMRANPQLILDETPINTWEEMRSAYLKRIKTYGLEHKSLFYPSEALHTTKLAHISRIIHLEVKTSDSVLDIGCGTGDLIPFLPTCVYRGVDLVSEFIEEARNRFPNLQFDCVNMMNLTDKYDWIILAGMMGTVPMPEMLIKKAWELAIKGIIVDFIDSRKYQGYLNGNFEYNSFLIFP